MVTWLQLWWELIAPFSLLGLLSVSLPTIHLKSGVYGSGPFREWLLNHCLLPVLPDDLASRVVAWWMQASVGQEVAMALLIALNVNVVLLPVLWTQGEATIHFRAWLARRSLADRRRLIRM